MLHLHCTAGLGKALKVKLMPAPNESDLDWLDCWYARHIPLDLPLDALLFTNASSNYSLVHPFDRRENPDEVVATFQQRLAWVLVTLGASGDKHRANAARAQLASL